MPVTLSDLEEAAGAARMRLSWRDSCDAAGTCNTGACWESTHHLQLYRARTGVLEEDLSALDAVPGRTPENSKEYRPHLLSDRRAEQKGPRREGKGREGKRRGRGRDRGRGRGRGRKVPHRKEEGYLAGRMKAIKLHRQQEAPDLSHELRRKACKADLRSRVSRIQGCVLVGLVLPAREASELPRVLPVRPQSRSDPLRRVRRRSNGLQLLSPASVLLGASQHAGDIASILCHLSRASVRYLFIASTLTPAAHLRLAWPWPPEPKRPGDRGDVQARHDDRREGELLLPAGLRPIHARSQASGGGSGGPRRLHAVCGGLLFLCSGTRRNDSVS
eukprot:scaffold7417_cov258-Pinguiococcus_pyrenoidosus.AAC.5